MKTVLFVSLFFLAAASGLQAQQLRVELNPIGGDLINDVDQSTVALHPATPFLESSSLLLADINLEKIDVVAIAKWLHDVMGTPNSVEATQTMEGFINSLQGGGVSHVYLSAATRSPLDGGPIVIAPCQNPAVVQGLATVLIEQVPDSEQQKVHVGDKVVVAGAAQAVDRVVTRQGVDRPDLILPLKGVDLLDHTVVVALPAEAREELLALWPEQLAVAPLPNPISPRQIVGDVSHVIVSLRLPPEPEMMVRIETIDAIAADRVKHLVDQAMTIVGDLSSMLDVKIDIASVSLRATPETFFKIASIIAAPARQRATQLQKMNSLKQIGLALHNYHANEKHFPNRVLADSQGRPLMSWRVSILPYLDQQALYRDIKLDQPWDSEANQLFSSVRIPVYCSDLKLPNKTTIRAPVFPGSLWQGDGPPKAIRDIRDGTSNTIAVIDAPTNAAIEWSNPQPWVLSEDDPMSDVFGDRESTSVLMLDGSALVLSRDSMTNEKLKAMLTIAGGEVIKR